MITNINPNAIKDGTISASKTDETIATKEELTELSLKVGKFSEITPTLSSGVQIATLKKEVEGQEVTTPLYAPQGGGGETPWTLKYEHTFVADEPTLTITDIGSNFLLLIDYNGTLAVAQNVLMEYGNNSVRINNPFGANRQIHMSVELHNDGIITSVETSYSEWNNREATNVKMANLELAKRDSISIYATNGRIPEGTILKLY